MHVMSDRRLNGLAALLGFVMAVVTAQSAVAAPSTCQLKLSTSGSNWSISGYNPFSSSPTSRTFNVTFTNNGGATCNFAVLFRTDGGPLGLAGAGGQRLPYTLADNTNNLNVTPITGQTEAASQANFSIAPGGQRTVQYAYTVDLTTLPTDGDFTQQLDLTAQTGAVVIQDKSIALSLNVAPSAVIGLRGAYTSHGGGAYVELGDLKQGTIASMLQLYVQSTGGYQIDATSENSGKLELSGAPQWSIPYTVDIGGNVMNLSSASSFRVSRGASARQDLLPIAFTIGEIDQKRAGEYRDVITLSVTAT
jgi:hypothetical protein